MQVVKYQLDENVYRQTLRLPGDYNIMCVKKSYVDGKMCPCLYLLNYDTEPGVEEEVTLHFFKESVTYPDTNQMNYVGEYVSGVYHSEYRTFVFMTHDVLRAVV